LHKSLVEEPKTNNKEKLSTRTRVEHVFSFLKQHAWLYCPAIAITRAKAKIGMMNLTHNTYFY